MYSTGNPGTIAAFGTTIVANDDVTLTAADPPSGQFGYFLNSQTMGFFNPPGSNGFLCLSGSIGRHNQPGAAGMGPTFSLQLDLGALPQPTSFVAVVPGETWSFQCWYRDAGGTNNFTDGVSITFF